MTYPPGGGYSAILVITLYDGGQAHSNCAGRAAHPSGLSVGRRLEVEGTVGRVGERGCINPLYHVIAGGLMPAPRWMAQAASEEFSRGRRPWAAHAASLSQRSGLIFVIVYVAAHALIANPRRGLRRPAVVACTIRADPASGIQQTVSGFWRRRPWRYSQPAATGRGENYFAWGSCSRHGAVVAYRSSRSVPSRLLRNAYRPPTGWQRKPSSPSPPLPCHVDVGGFV